MYRIGRLPNGDIASPIELGHTPLQALRERIDALDKELAPLLAEFSLLDKKVQSHNCTPSETIRHGDIWQFVMLGIEERLSISREIAVHKTPGHVQDPQREQCIHERYNRVFMSRGADVNHCHTLVDGLLQLSRNAQERVLQDKEGIAA